MRTGRWPWNKVVEALSNPRQWALNCETDALIASAARSRGAVLVHRDAHMRAIPATLVGQLDLET